MDAVVLFWQYQYHLKFKAASMLVTSVSIHARKANRRHCPWTRWMSALPSRKHISLVAFAATEFNEMFSGRQPRQGVKFAQCYRDKTRTGFGFTKPLATPRKWGRNQSLKRRTFIPWRVCLPEKILLDAEGMLCDQETSLFNRSPKL
jgi:hypothetical protein